MSDLILPDKNWTSEEIDAFIEEHQIEEAKNAKNNFAKIGVIKKWAEKNNSVFDANTDSDSNDENDEKPQASVKMTDTYFDMDRSRIFIELEVSAKDKRDAFEYIAMKEKAIVEKFNIKRANGESDIEVMTHTMAENLVRASITIPTHYMQQVLKDAIVNA